MADHKHESTYCCGQEHSKQVSETCCSHKDSHIHPDHDQITAHAAAAMNMSMNFIITRADAAASTATNPIMKAAPAAWIMISP